MMQLEAKLILAWRMGEVNLKMNRKRELVAKFGSTECWVQVCGGNDDLDHVIECFGYYKREPAATVVMTRWKPGGRR